MIKVRIEHVQIGNDHTDDHGWLCMGTAAICYDGTDKQLGIHFVVPGHDEHADYVLRDIVASNDLYEIEG